jgi:hypothetical protein
VVYFTSRFVLAEIQTVNINSTFGAECTSRSIVKIFLTLAGPGLLFYMDQRNQWLRPYSGWGGREQIGIRLVRARLEHLHQAVLRPQSESDRAGRSSFVRLTGPAHRAPVPSLAPDQIDRRRADKPCNEQALGLAIELVRRADLFDPAALISVVPRGSPGDCAGNAIGASEPVALRQKCLPRFGTSQI